jgi:hypothetical protein
MRAGRLADRLSVYGSGLERLDAANAAVGVAALVALLLRSRHKNVTDVAALLRSAVREELAVGKPSVGELLTALGVLRDLVSAFEVRKQAELLDSLSELETALGGFEPYSIESYMKELSRRVASVSRRTKRGPADVNEALVSDYLKRLEEALPDAGSFQLLFDELLADDRIQQAEAVALASRFLSPTSATTSRAKALAKIMERHSTLMRSRADRKAGKSAA